jgi:FMN-dependent oxidoreductase (nitrilotriacetate monooxygenase family)
MKLGMFYWPCGHHLAAWRHPEGVADSGGNLAHIIELAKLAERGLFDMFFMADSVSFWRADLEAMTRDSYGTWIEPFTLMCALSQHTRHLGLVCTATTTYDQPYLLARRFASLDLISGGRAGWNLVTSGNRAEADSFGLPEHMAKADRYRRAREFAHVVRGLWNAWGDGAFVRDKDSGVYFDKDKLFVLEHAGEFFRARGPINVPPSPQGEPVLVQAGASDDGRELAAETAEVIFGAQQTLAGAQAFYADVKGRMAACGRDPDGLKIMPGLLVSVATRHDEAVAKYEALQDLIDPRAGLQLLSRRLDYDLSGFPVDGPLPDIPRNKVASSRVDLFVEIARREELTIRDLYRRIAGARGHMEVIGTPAEVADMMEEWVAGRACDGFNIMPPVFPGSLVDFIELVIPELQRRGLYRTAYAGTTLRDNLGLTRPRWPAQRRDERERATAR